MCKVEKHGIEKFLRIEITFKCHYNKDLEVQDDHSIVATTV